MAIILDMMMLMFEVNNLAIDASIVAGPTRWTDRVLFCAQLVVQSSNGALSLQMEICADFFR